MATVALTGRGGVTTTTVAMALSWPRDVTVIEADPTGGSAILAGYLRGTILHRGGLRDLAFTARTRDGAALVDALAAVSIPLDVQAPHVGLIPGIVSTAQAQHLSGLWHPLLDALDLIDGAATPRDALVDLGRPDARDFAFEVFEQADLSLIVTRTDLVSLVKTRATVEALTTRLHDSGIGTEHVRLLALGASPYTTAELQAAFGLQVPVLHLPLDPARAAVFSDGVSRRAGSWPRPGLRVARWVGKQDAYIARTFAGSAYVQGLNDLVSQVVAALAPERGPGRQYTAEADSPVLAEGVLHG